MVPISGILMAKSLRISSRKASNSSSARSTSSISSTGGLGRAALQRLQQRAPDEELLAEDVPGGGGRGLAARLEQPDLQHLPRIVPLVHRGVDVEPLVTLKPDELAAEHASEGARHLGLAHAGLAFQQQGPAQGERQEDRGREIAIGDVALGGEGGLDGVDVGGRRHGSGDPRSGSRNIVGAGRVRTGVGGAMPGHEWSAPARRVAGERGRNDLIRDYGLGFFDIGAMRSSSSSAFSSMVRASLPVAALIWAFCSSVSSRRILLLGHGALLGGWVCRLHGSDASAAA